MYHLMTNTNIKIATTTRNYGLILDISIDFCIKGLFMMRKKSFYKKNPNKSLYFFSPGCCMPTLVCAVCEVTKRPAKIGSLSESTTSTLPTTVRESLSDSGLICHRCRTKYRKAHKRNMGRTTAVS